MKDLLRRARRGGRAGRRRRLVSLAGWPALFISAEADAAWSNGEHVTADDFVAGLRRAVDPSTASPGANCSR